MRDVYPRTDFPPESAPRAAPRHVAIIMDGNGRWATRRGLPRQAGHRAGVKAARAIVQTAARRGIDVLTLFAFSSENWRRPAREVGFLMNLFAEALQREIAELHRNAGAAALHWRSQRTGVGIDPADGRGRSPHARQHGPPARHRRGLRRPLGPRASRTQAGRRCARGRIEPAAIDEARVGAELAVADLPDPDLFIRTGGEMRVSNFLLWNLAYTELYFSPLLWPDFDAAALDEALEFYAGRERSFGRTVAESESAGP